MFWWFWWFCCFYQFAFFSHFLHVFQHFSTVLRLFAVFFLLFRWFCLLIVICKYMVYKYCIFPKAVFVFFRYFKGLTPFLKNRSHLLRIGGGYSALHPRTIQAKCCQIVLSKWFFGFRNIDK